MASLAEARIYADTADDAERAFAAIEREVARIEAKYSRYRSDSVLSHINGNAGGDALEVDAETSALLDYADACWRQSDGLFDITSGVLRTVWDFKSGRPPTQASVRAVLHRIGWNRVRRDTRSIGLDAGMEIDFGGIGKEYAADRAMAAATAAGIDRGFVNLGGDIRVIAPHADGRPWRIGIVHPRDPSRAIAHLELHEGGLATSGDYERFFEFEGQRYCHILDPRTGWPVDCPQSVSVIAPLCTVAGSSSTIAMLHGDRAEAYLRENGVSYLIVDRDGNVTTNTAT
jgi:thiamine biosynthesis lipoprotein